MRKGVRRVLTWASIIAVIFTTFDLGFYFWRFAPGHWWALAQDSEDWARFGEFVGGTLGPLFALLAFGSALFAISEQNKQANLAELQRLMFGMYGDINRLLSAKPPKLDTIAAQQLRGIDSLGELLIALYKRSIFSSPDAQPIADLVVSVASDCVRREAAVIEVELVHFVSLLEEYGRQGGSEAVITFYRDRYRELVCGMHIANRLTSNYVPTFFEPERCIEIARERAAREELDATRADGTGS